MNITKKMVLDLVEHIERAGQDELVEWQFRYWASSGKP